MSFCLFIYCFVNVYPVISINLSQSRLQFNTFFGNPTAMLLFGIIEYFTIKTGFFYFVFCFLKKQMVSFFRGGAMTPLHSFTVTMQNGTDPMVWTFNNSWKIKVLRERNTGDHRAVNKALYTHRLIYLSMYVCVYVILFQFPPCCLNYR